MNALIVEGGYLIKIPVQPNAFSRIAFDPVGVFDMKATYTLINREDCRVQVTFPGQLICPRVKHRLQKLKTA